MALDWLVGFYSILWENAIKYVTKALKGFIPFDSVVPLLGNYSKKIIRDGHGDWNFKTILNVVRDRLHKLWSIFMINFTDFKVHAVEEKMKALIYIYNIISEKIH